MDTLPTPSLAQFLNMQELLDRVNQDREFLRELFGIFAREFPRLCLRLQEAAAEENMQQTAKSAHLLKGMLANLSLERAAAAAGTLEEMAVAEDRPGVEHALAGLNDELVGLLPALDAYLAEPQ